MRLLNTSTFKFQTFADHDRPPYAIASHRWEGNETTYHEMLQDQGGSSNGFAKVTGFCHLVNRMNKQIGPVRALNDLGLRRQCDWLWIDTACINKQDGAELSESINSMFSWYGNSSICYAYLSDVKPAQKIWSSSKLDLMRSQWFKRGWTLQELLAPRTVVFVAKDWTVIGHKCAYSDKVCSSVCQGFGDRLNKSIAHITGIPQNIINSSMAHELRAVPVEDKLAWAKKRITTRTEDQAYCLLGLLDVFISPIYGEGENAWARLVQALEYKQSLQTSGPAAKASKSSMWFRLRGVKKEVKQEGRYASATTMTTVVSGYTSAPFSLPPQRPVHSESAVIRPPVSVPILSRPAQSMGVMGVRSSSPPSAPQIGRSLPSTNSVSSRMPSAPQFGGYTQSMNAMYYESGALSAPADADMYLTPAGLDSAIYHEDGAISAPAGPLTGYVAALRSGVTQQTHQTYLAPGATTMGAANTTTTDQYWGIIEEEPTLVSSNSKLKHRYGSGWSFHDAETGYNSQWIHELEDTSLSMGTKHIFEPLGTAVIVRNVTALFDFIPDTPDELAFTKGDTISVIESVFQDWWRGSLGGRTGIFPLNYVQKLDPRVDDSGSVVTESTEVDKVVRGPANISTLMEGRRPDVDDWLKHDGLSPGLMSNFQWQRLSTTYIDVEAELTRGDEIEARPGTPEYEMPKAAATSLKQRPVSAQLGRKLVNDSVLGKRFKQVVVEQPVSPLSVSGVEDQNQQLINAIAASSLVSEHHKPIPQGLPSTLPATSTAIIQPIPQRQKLPADIALNKLNSEDNDGDSIQADDFWAECWQPPVLTRVTTSEQTKQETNVVTWSDEAQPQSAVVMKQVTTNTTISPPTEIPDTIHIPRIVLKALLEQQARPIAGPSNETELLANTAVEYIRELLLSQNGTQNSLQAKPSGVVESVEIKTAKYEATSVTQMLSATATNMTKGERVVEVNTTELPDDIAAG